MNLVQVFIVAVCGISVAFMAIGLWLDRRDQRQMRTVVEQKREAWR